MISGRFKNDGKPLLKLNNVQLTAKGEVEKKISDGEYKFENIRCPVCDSDKSDVLSEKDRYGLHHTVVACKSCGLIYTNPRMDQDSYNSFYNTEYRRLYVGNEVPTKSFFSGQYHKGRLIYDFLQSTFPKKTLSDLSVLEVGCGAGGILYYFKSKGCKVKGLDLGNEYIEYGKENYQLDLNHGSLTKDLNFTPDIVIYSHVLEHILDLHAELQKIKEICHKDSIIYIEVPGIKNIRNSYKMNTLLYLQNAHTFHFTLTSLTNVFVKNGFRRIRGTEFVRSVFSVESSESVEILNEYPDVVQYLQNMDRNRFLYPFRLSSIKRGMVFTIFNVLKRIRLLSTIKKLTGKAMPVPEKL